MRVAPIEVAPSGRASRRVGPAPLGDEKAEDEVAVAERAKSRLGSAPQGDDKADPKVVELDHLRATLRDSGVREERISRCLEVLASAGDGIDFETRSALSQALSFLPLTALEAPPWAPRVCAALIRANPAAAFAQHEESFAIVLHHACDADPAAREMMALLTAHWAARGDEGALLPLCLPLGVHEDVSLEVRTWTSREPSLRAGVTYLWFVY